MQDMPINREGSVCKHKTHADVDEYGQVQTVFVFFFFFSDCSFFTMISF